MEQNIFFAALSTSLLTSVIQGFIVYVISKLLLSAVPDLSAEKRFRFLYGTVALIFIGFVVSIALNYNSGIIKTESFTSQFSIVPTIAAAGDTQGLFDIGGYTKWIAALYFTGLLVQAAIILTGFYRLRSLRFKNKILANKFWEDRLQALSAKLNFTKKVDLHVAERIFSPFTAGFLRPMIIFPVAMLNSLTTEQVEAILLHELAHIKRNDYLLNIVHKIIETVLFFNPFVWLLSKEIRREREFACDDLVVEHIGDSNQYARALLYIAESKLQDCSFGIAASGNNKYTLFDRIKRLTNMKTQNNNPKSGMFAVVCIAAALLSLAWVMPSDTTKANNETTGFKEATPVSFTYGAEPEIPNQPSEAPLPSLSPLPSLPNLRSVLEDLPVLHADTDTNHVNKYFKSAEWKQHMENLKSHVAEMKKQFESPEWKKQMMEMKVNSDEMKKHFESAEWKQQMQDMKLQSEEMKKRFESPEWKKQMRDMKINAEQMKTHTLAMQKEFNSPEWKKKIEDMKAHSQEIKKKFESPEWKKQIEEMKSNSAEIKKQFESPEWKKQIEEIKKMAQEMKLEAEKAEKEPVIPKN